MFEKLKKEMASQGLTTNRLAKLSDIAAPDLYCAIGGKKPFYAGWRKRVAKVLGVPEECLFTAEEVEQ